MTKTCYECKRDLPRSAFTKDRSRLDGLHYRCKKCRSRYYRAYKALNLEKCKKRVRKAKARYRVKLRKDVLIHYGGEVPKCACCGENRDEFLCLDHINGGGNEHRRKIGEGGQRTYMWVRKNHYPEGFRVLCLNCNGSLGSYGYCPHERERGAV